MSKIRLLIVDDHPLVRMGLETLIGDRVDMQVVGQAGTADDALREVTRLRPDIVVMDIRMSGDSGIEATRQICRDFPATKVIILTSYSDDALVLRAIQAGAVGYVLKQADNAELLLAITAAARGEALLNPTATAGLLSQVRKFEKVLNQSAFHPLSEREITVLAQLARGKTNAEIGERLSLSEKTVRNHVSAILEKLALTNRVELAAYAIEHRVFDHLHTP